MKIYYTGCMQQIMTAKVKLHTTPEQFRALRATQLMYRDALNYVSRYAFEHGKMSNRTGGLARRDATKRYVRALHLPAQMAC